MSALHITYKSSPQPHIFNTTELDHTGSVGKFNLSPGIRTLQNLSEFLLKIKTEHWLIPLENALSPLILYVHT